MKREQAKNFYKFLMDKGYEPPLLRRLKYDLADVSEIKTPEDIGITKYEFDSNGYLDVQQHVDLWGYGLTKLPFKFGFVDGDFNCSDNKLTSLEGAPKEVNGYFDCRNNKLTSLKGAPEVVGDGFYCSNNQLTSLKGAPKEVEWSFFCSHNKLTSLKGAPKEVNGDFNCSNNQLISLVGAPWNVGGDFNCSDNKLTSLEGGPRNVSDFHCKNNTKQFTEEDVRTICHVRFSVYV